MSVSASLTWAVRTPSSDYAPDMVEAVVRQWDHEEGWGVLDAPETPGGCWTHFSHVEMDGYRTLTRGQQVDLEWESPGQDGYDFRAVCVRPVAVAASRPHADVRMAVRRDSFPERHRLPVRESERADKPRDVTRSVHLTVEEQHMLVVGLTDWGGPLEGTEALAVAMGFVSLEDLMDEGERIARGIAAEQPLSDRDWIRAVTVTAIAFALEGDGWTTIQGGTDAHWIEVLRRVQRKVGHTDTHLGTPPSAPAAEPTSTLGGFDRRLLLDRTPERLERPVPPVDT